MRKGYIYVASNPALRDGLFKVGLTTDKPVHRVHSLSRSSSIPADFVLEHFREVKDVVAAEARIHLLLSECRYAVGKEFFCIDLVNAEYIVERVANYLEMHEDPCKGYGFSDEYLLGYFEGKLSATPYRYMHLMAALSIGQSSADHLFGLPIRMVSGFASADCCAALFCTKRASAMAFMRKFCDSYRDCWFVTGSRKRIKVFEYLRYYRGHMAWRYSEDFRPLVLNGKNDFW